jgi:protein-S-isoprenylcysteine O-methyltransferase Ste14
MMNNILDDHPNVIVFPPLILIATILLAALLQWTIPLDVFATIDRSLRIAVGGVLFAIGAALAIAGARALIRHGTNVNPLRPALTLTTNGIYGWTRNPMYDGGAPVLLGLALMFSCDWLALLMVPSYLVLYFAVISREERYLERKFGAPYQRYCAQVPRHLLPR